MMVIHPPKVMVVVVDRVKVELDSAGNGGGFNNPNVSNCHLELEPGICSEWNPSKSWNWWTIRWWIWTGRWKQ